MSEDKIHPVHLLPTETLWAQLKQAAKQDNRPLNRHIIHLMEQDVKARGLDLTPPKQES